ncbi:MAG: SufE family protein [Acetobacteraceae bacterium]|nr:SufE family protein [Acetobacteraceae bacterium]MDW8399365.1 SufE family protein [Acetobacteraceae bacterium]
MSSAFFQPTEPTAAEAIAAIADELSFFEDWMDRYRQIIDWGRTLPPFPEAWKDKAHKVEGCQSQVWLAAEERDGRIFLAGASDAAIVSGLIALLLRVYSGRSPREILGTDPGFLKDLGLIGNLSGTRANGVVAMIGRIREIAARAAAA